MIIDTSTILLEVAFLRSIVIILFDIIVSSEIVHHFTTLLVASQGQEVIDVAMGIADLKPVLLKNEIDNEDDESVKYFMEFLRKTYYCICV